VTRPRTRTLLYDPDLDLMAHLTEEGQGLSLDIRFGAAVVTVGFPRSDPKQFLIATGDLFKFDRVLFDLLMAHLRRQPPTPKRRGRRPKATVIHMPRRES
jgi:hypothetical protein